MKATEQLKAEHKAVKLMLDILDKIRENAEIKSEINLLHLEQIIEFLQVFVDKCHHAKEEELLFPVMEQAEVPNIAGPIGVMLSEHGAGREYVRNLFSAAARLKANDQTGLPEIINILKNYGELLNKHIDKENNILFLLADTYVSEKQQEDLYNKFEELETERIGIGKHEEFHGLINQLKKIYLS